MVGSIYENKDRGFSFLVDFVNKGDFPNLRVILDTLFSSSLQNI